jgi:hypothetical protein
MGLNMDGIKRTTQLTIIAIKLARIFICAVRALKEEWRQRQDCECSSWEAALHRNLPIVIVQNMNLSDIQAANWRQHKLYLA